MTTILIDCEEDTDVVRLHTLKHAISSIQLSLVSHTPPKTLSDQPNTSFGDSVVETSNEDNLKAVHGEGESFNKYRDIVEELINVNESDVLKAEAASVYINGNHIEAQQDADSGIGNDLNKNMGSEDEEPGASEGLYEEGDEIEVEGCTLSRLYQFVAIKLTKKLRANMRYKLVIKSASHISSNFYRGLYSSSYIEDGETK